MKHHKGILCDDFMLLFIEYRIIESKKFFIFFQNFKIYVAMQNGCYGDFLQFLSAGHIMSNVNKQESYL